MLIVELNSNNSTGISQVLSVWSGINFNIQLCREKEFGGGGCHRGPQTLVPPRCRVCRGGCYATVFIRASFLPNSCCLRRRARSISISSLHSAWPSRLSLLTVDHRDVILWWWRRIAAAAALAPALRRSHVSHLCYAPLQHTAGRYKQCCGVFWWLWLVIAIEHQ